MSVGKRVAITIAAVVAWYTTATKTPAQEYSHTGSLEETLRTTPHHVTYVAETGHKSLDNLEFLDNVIQQSKENGLYDRLESFLVEKYGQAPREQYRIGHDHLEDNLEDSVVAYTNNSNTIGLGPNFKELSQKTAQRYGISPTLAAFLTYGHERAHMAQNKYDQQSVKHAEIDVDETMEEFLLREESLAKTEGRYFDAYQFRNAADYQQDRITAVQQDLIERYRDAA